MKGNRGRGATSLVLLWIAVESGPTAGAQPRTPDVLNRTRGDCGITAGVRAAIEQDGLSDDCPLVDIVEANPPMDNPFILGQQPFRDVLQDISVRGLISQGIGAAGTPAGGAVTYHPISVLFSGTPLPAPVPGNITVECTGGSCPRVTSVLGSGAGPYSISLDGPIPPGHCTTFTFAGANPGQKLRYESLPGDVNHSGKANVMDVLFFVNAIASGEVLAPANVPRYDLDRSGSHSGADLPRLIQLLNGINTTQAWLSVSVSACQDGACCLPNGQCVATTPTDCNSQCGVFGGLGASCSMDTCDPQPTGACCLQTDACADVTACECTQLGGEFHGAGSGCTQNCCATGCTIATERELFIRHPSVVDDPVRRACTGPNPLDCGSWTWTALMTAVAGTNDRQALSDFVTNLLLTWDTNQTVNSDLVEARCQMEVKFLQPMRDDSGGDLLDFQQVEKYFRLLAIVSRIDLRNDDPNLETVKAGEGRFVFAPLPAQIVGGQYVFGPDGKHTHVTNDSITNIFEFRLPGQTCQDVLTWANQWHGLSGVELPFPSPQYNAALQGITDQFATIGAAPGRPNGSALAQWRFNEIELVNPVSPPLSCAPPLGGPWELREFRLFCVDGSQGACAGRPLTPTTVEQEPDRIHNNTPLLANWMNANAQAILDGAYRVPLFFPPPNGTVAFRGGHSLVTIESWDAPGVPENVRSAFALNTCSGCHQTELPDTFFTHVKNRPPGGQSAISAFLFVPGPNNDDLDRRAADLCDVIMAGCCQGASPVTGDGDESSSPSAAENSMLPRPAFSRGRPH